MKIFLLALTFFYSVNALGVTRFKAEQLSFTLFQEGQSAVACTHKKLSNKSPAEPPPWWVVSCGDRKYTVDIWMDEFQTKDKMHNLLVLFHAKEGVASSGEKLTRFNTQTTRIKSDDASLVKAITSGLDMRNGLADLVVDVQVR